MGTFLLLLLLFFVVIPLVRGMWQLWRIRRAYRQAQQRMNDIFNGGATAGQRAQRPRPQRKKKKIDSDVGEYVSFEEIRTETKSTTTGGADNTATERRSTRVESQVEDAEWEDL